MKFELKPDNRNASDEELINDLIKVANKLKKNTITRNEYDKHGRFSEGTLRKRFGGWVKALEKASFSASRNGNLSNEEIIAELKRIARLLGVKFLTTEQFNKHKKLSNTTTITKRFGSWNKALKKAGLNVSPNYKKQYSDNELFENLLNLWVYYGRQPKITDLNKHPSAISAGTTYTRRFGNWRNALEAFVDYANKGEAEAFEKEVENNEEMQTFEPKNQKKIIQHKTSRNINLRLRFLVMKRDNFKCKNCGRSPATDHSVILHIDHIKPWSKGGETVLENLQTLCSQCNLGKSDL